VSHDTRSMQAARSLPAAADTDRLGRALAQACHVHAAAIEANGLQVNVQGDLGAGKTALVRGWLRGFGIRGPIRSPTFAVLEPYVVTLRRQATAGRDVLEAQTLSSLDFYHFDFYRFADPAEFSTAGFREQFGPGRICAIEWPEKAGDRLPGADLTITLQVEGDGRLATLVAVSSLGHACLASALKEFDTTAVA
jgi:tRNA threonylcarbamoyladenosine biosynthesis protein TsaE